MNEATRAALAKAIAAIGHKTFATAFLHTIEATVEHDAAALMLFPHNAPPSVLADHLNEAERGILYGDYLAGVYLLSPFFRVATGLDRPRAVRVRDIAPEGFSASEYHRRYFARIGVADMLGVLVPVRPAGTLFASLSRATGQRQFGKADVDRATGLLEILAALAQRHVDLGNHFAAPHTPAKAGSGKLATALTAREADVVHLILAGHSSRSVAANLGISAETVRVHRRHIYAKLEISSQAELFRWFLAARRE